MTDDLTKNATALQNGRSPLEKSLIFMIFIGFSLYESYVDLPDFIFSIYGFNRGHHLPANCEVIWCTKICLTFPIAHTATTKHVWSLLEKSPTFVGLFYNKYLTFSIAHASFPLFLLPPHCTSCRTTSTPTSSATMTLLHTPLPFLTTPSN